MKENTENYILQSSMHMRWLKVTQTPSKELKLSYASVFIFSTANDPQTGGHPHVINIHDFMGGRRFFFIFG